MGNNNDNNNDNNNETKPDDPAQTLADSKVAAQNELDDYFELKKSSIPQKRLMR